MKDGRFIVRKKRNLLKNSNKGISFDRLKKNITRMALMALGGILTITGINLNNMLKEKNDEKVAPVNLISEGNIPELPKKIIDINNSIQDIIDKKTIEKELIINKDLSLDEEINFFDTIDLSSYYGLSLIDALIENNYPSSYKFRKELAEYFGIVNYEGTAEQNLYLLEILGGHVLVRENGPVRKLTKNNNNHLNNNNNNSSNSSSNSWTNNTSNSVHKHEFGIWFAKDEDKEQRECSCGHIETRDHNYKKIKIDIISNKNGTHKKVLTEKCSNCGLIREKVLNTSNCNYSDWKYNKVTGKEERKCNGCDHIEIRKHKHQYSEWHYFDDLKEQRICFCGHVETRSHKYKVEKTSYVANENGTHNKVLEEICETCNHKRIKTVSTLNCNYSGWKYNKETGKEERVCRDCGHIEIRNHIHELSPKEIVENAKDGIHNEIQICNKCGEKITKEVPCTNDGKIYYRNRTDGKIEEYNICRECKKAFNIKVHEHKYNEWHAISDFEEQSKCSCGHTETREHKYEVKNTYYIYNGDGTHRQMAEEECSTCGHNISSRVLSNSSCNYSAWKYNEEKGLLESECEVCGHKKTIKHEHKFGDWKYNPETKNDERICNDSDCGLIQTRKHNHQYNEWHSINDLQEQRECSCGHKQTRLHEYEIKNTYYIYNGEGTHHQIAEEECKKCNHTRTRILMTSNCHFSEWKYNEESGLLERKCESCGHKEAIKHEHNVTNWIYNEETKELVGTCSDPRCGHEVREAHNHKVDTWTYDAETKELVGTCSDPRCGHEVRESHEHTYSNWIYNPETKNDERICNVCGTIEIREHEHEIDLDSKHVTSNSKEGVHNISYKCKHCGKTISEEVPCTSDGKVYYDKIEGTTKEYSKCSECKEKFNERTHTHQFGDIINKDDINEYRECTCGEIKNTAHNYDDGVTQENGTIIFTCKDCGHIKTQTHTHKFITKTEYPFEEDYNGVCTRTVTTCENCNYKEITPHGHTWTVLDSGDDYQIVSCDVCGFYTVVMTNPISAEENIHQHEEEHVLTRKLQK